MQYIDPQSGEVLADTETGYLARDWTLEEIKEDIDSFPADGLCQVCHLDRMLCRQEDGAWICRECEEFLA